MPDFSYISYIIENGTTSAPEIAATGSDTNIDLKLTPKGDGNLVLDGIEFPNADGTADQVLQTDGSGNLSFASVGITEADQWRLTAAVTADTNPISANLERVDNVGFNYIGTGMSVNSGTWTFPRTGIYLVRYNTRVTVVPDDNIAIDIETTTNNSTYAIVAGSQASGDGSATAGSGAQLEIFFDVTDTSTHKVRFTVFSLNAGSLLGGNTNENQTYFTFIRLGDT